MGQNKFTAEDLKQYQALPLDIKVRMTYLRIRWWLNEFDGYVSFSGGKDSTVLLHVARQYDPDIPAVFVDTGLEFPEIKEFALSQKNVTRIRPEMNFRKVIETYGYPIISKNVSRAIHDVKKLGDNCWFARAFDGRETGLYNYQKYKYLIDSPFLVSDQCCNIMKKKPLKKYEKETGRTPLCNAYDSKNPKSQPMSFWTEQDVLQYIKQNNLPYASVYGDIVEDKNGKLKTTGCDRTGCVFCMFGCYQDKDRFPRLKQTHPKLWEYCMKDWDSGGLGMKDVLDFINVNIQ